MPARAPFRFALRAAANATAALGSITCFARSHTTRMRVDDLVFAHRHHRLDVLAQHAERAVGEPGEQAVGDRRGRDGGCSVPDASERAASSARSGSPPITRTPGRTPCVAMHVPEHEPAAADRRDDDVEVGDLLEQLERGGARARDHAVVVERMDLDRAGAVDAPRRASTRAPRACCRST